MNISIFDLHWNQKTWGHWIIIYSNVSFDGQKLYFSKKEIKNLPKILLTKRLNNSDFRICHNFFWYDSKNLPLLDNHFEKNIDTLLIDCLFFFNKNSHNLEKSFKNTPIEDIENTFLTLEKNLVYFHKLNNLTKNIFYKLLKNEEKYKSFFEFYENITNFNFEKESIKINNFSNFLSYKNLENEKVLNNINLFLKNNKYLCLAYFIIFLEKGIITLPKFISKEYLSLKNDLKILLSENFSILSDFFKKDKNLFLKEFFGFSDFRWDFQKKWVDYSLEQKNFLTILSTWWWKSLIYQLPAYITWKKLWDLTIIITPLKALIKDQIDWLLSKWFNFVEKLSWDQNNLEKEIVKARIESGVTKILFLTPEWLRNKNTLEILKNRFISRIVIDEAHTLVLWWQEFRPDYFFISDFLKDLENISLNKNISLTLLTATATTDVESWILKYFSDKKIEIIKNKNILKENILWSVVEIKDKKEKEHLILEKIKQINISENSSIIFVWRQKTAEDLESIFKINWIESRAFHAWINDFSKKEIQKDFISWKINLIIATKAFWMWIDKENVRYVIHYDLPWNIEDYTQEIWRAWRDWKISKNIIFYEKESIKKRVSDIKRNGLKYFHIINFLKNIQIKEKITISPREIAIKSWIKTNKKNWQTDVKILLSFLELNKILWKNILKRRYDNNLVIFNKIENKIVNECYKEIENNNFLNVNEKNLAKEIIYKIVEQKYSLDLNNLEENFSEDIWESIDFKNIKISKITKILRSLKILWMDNENKEQEIIIEAKTIKEKNFRENNYFYYNNIINNFENFNDKNKNYYKNLKRFYLEKWFLTEKNWNIFIKNNELLKENFNYLFSISEKIIWFIFKTENDFKEKIVINNTKLLKFLQENISLDFSISRLREVLYFMFCLDLINIKSWILVFINRYDIYFSEKVIENTEDFKKNLENDDFKKEVIEKLDFFNETKILKLFALAKIVEILKEKWISSYTNLTNYYFNNSLKEFSDEFLEKSYF